MITPTPHLVALVISLACLLTDSLAAESLVMRAFSGIEKNLDSFAAPAEQKKSSWYKFEKKIGKETIRLEFPKKPDTCVENNVYAATLLSNGMQFGLLAPNTPTGNLDVDALFDAVITDLINAHYKITSQTRSENGDDEILEVTCVDKEGITASAFNVYVTTKNFYMYGVDYMNKKPSSDIDKFMNSFSVSH